MEEYICLRCGSELSALKGTEAFCTKCKRKMWNIKKLNRRLGESLTDGILMSIQEQLELNTKY